MTLPFLPKILEKGEQMNAPNLNLNHKTENKKTEKNQRNQKFVL